MDEDKILRKAVVELAFWARRYCDGRQTYAVRSYNELIESLLEIGIDFDTTDGIIWARDGGGRDFDGLTEDQAKPGTAEAKGKW